MKILSIYPYTHLSSASLLIDGKIVAASPEERFNREKLSTKFPIQSANWCLESQGLSWEDIDIIAVPWNPMRNINHASKRWVSQLIWRGEMLSHVPTQIMRAMQGPMENEMELRFGNNKIIYFDHHDCHAANGFYLSGFEKADILTIDGHGENETCWFGVGNGAQLEKKHSILYPHSVGLFYGTFTDYLGFTPDVDEWKVMALYSYSPKKNKYDDLIGKLITLTETGFELDLSYFDFYTFDRREHFYTQKLLDLLGPARIRNAELNQRHYDIAGAMQRTFVKSVQHLMKIGKKMGGGSGNIVLSGGAAMNCVFNGELDSMDIYDNSFISSCPDDSGVAVGACLLAHYRYASPTYREVKECDHNYWGPSYSDDEIKTTIEKCKLKYEKPKDLIGTLAKEISEGKLVGWFQGSMEFGHRALGNRSILADPRYEETKNKINLAVKYRESYRPFAPLTLAESASSIFEMPKYRRVNFMERAYPIKKEWQPQLGAVTHVDGTGRVQTLERKSNPLLYDLIEKFGQLTDVPVLLNTSFNLNGEPIVMKPEHAVRTFYSCGLDLLVMGPYIVRK